MGFIAEISSAFVDVVARIMGAPSHGTRDPVIFLLLVIAGIGLVWLRRINNTLNEELLRTREVLHEKGRIDDLKLKVDDITYKVSTELTNFSQQIQKSAKRIITLEEKAFKQPVKFELDTGETKPDEQGEKNKKEASEEAGGKKSAEQSTKEKQPEKTAPSNKAREEDNEPSLWHKALERTRERLHQQLFELIRRTSPSSSRFTTAVRDMLEEQGLAPCWNEDFQSALEKIMGSGEQDPSIVRERLEAALAQVVKQQLQSGSDAPILPKNGMQRPRVVMLVGANSTERLEVAAELAIFLKKLGAKVLLGDCNPIDSKNKDLLVAWGAQAGVPVLTSTSRTKPSQVAYRSIHKAQDEHFDSVILYGPDDLERKDATEQWDQLRSIIQREQPGAPHEMLYIDNLSEQSSKKQPASRMISPTGLIITGFDMSDRGGALVARSLELKAPIRFVVISQPKRRFHPFSPVEYATALCGTSTAAASPAAVESAPDHSL